MVERLILSGCLVVNDKEEVLLLYQQKGLDVRNDEYVHFNFW